MKTIKKLSLLVLAVLMTSLVFGQPKHGKRPSKEKVQAMKIAYITDKLDLNSEEAQQFWPIYNEYDSKAEATRRAMRKMHKKDVSIDEMTDAEVEKMINTIDALRQKDLDIHKEYHAKFKAVLSIKKVAKLYKADQDFKRDLLKKIRDHKGPNGQHPQRKKRVDTDF